MSTPRVASKPSEWSIQGDKLVKAVYIGANRLTYRRNGEGVEVTHTRENGSGREKVFSGSVGDYEEAEGVLLSPTEVRREADRFRGQAGRTELAAKVLEAEYLHRNPEELDSSVDYREVKDESRGVSSPLSYLGDDRFEEMLGSAAGALDRAALERGKQYLRQNGGFLVSSDEGLQDWLES